MRAGHRWPIRPVRTVAQARRLQRHRRPNVRRPSPSVPVRELGMRGQHRIIGRAIPGKLPIDDDLRRLPHVQDDSIRRRPPRLSVSAVVSQDIPTQLNSAIRGAPVRELGMQGQHRIGRATPGKLPFNAPAAVRAETGAQRG